MKKGIIGICSLVHDTSACLVDCATGKVVYASAEERFSNIKSDHHIPFYTINECLKYAKKNNYNVKEAAVAYDPEYFLGDNFYKIINSILKNKKSTSKFIDFLKEKNSFFNIEFNFNFINNFFTSNMINIKKKDKRKIYELLTYHFNSMIKYKKINQILNDFLPGIKLINVRHHIAHAVSAYYNSGFEESNILVMDGQGEEDTITIFKAKKNTLKEISKTTWPYSIGYFYQIATFALNYKIGDEYKVMGMSAYGKNKFLKYLNKCFRLNNDGSLTLNKNPYLGIKFFRDTKYQQLNFTNKLLNLIEKPINNNFKQVHFDFAKSIQTIVEEIGLSLAKWAYNKNRSKNLCISGGVALNGLMNNNILNKSNYKNIYVYAASGDDGTSVGAAQYVVMKKNNFLKRKKVNQVFLGYEDNKIKNKNYIKKKLHINLDFVKCKNVFKFIARELTKNKVFAIYSGKSEFGPRALGSRSIIANALDKNIKKELNLKIKIREPFRPFAPIVLNDDYKKYFKLNFNSEFMLFICGTVEKFRKFMPGVVHRDNTARVQTVGRDNKIFYKILSEFKKITKIPVLINTSFNIGGEAMVNSLEDALNSFNQMDIDYLLVGEYLIQKKKRIEKKKIDDFIDNRNKLFNKKNPFPRIDILRLNANFYTKTSRVIIEKMKDNLRNKIKGKLFIK